MPGILKQIGIILSVASSIVLLSALIFLIIQLVQYRNDPNPDKSFLKPRFEIAGIEIRKLDQAETEGSMRIKIKNPLPVGFTLNNLKCALYLSGEDVLEKSYLEPVSVKAQDSAFFEFPVSLQNQKVIAIRRKAMQEKTDSIEFELLATFSTNLPFGRNVSVDIKKKRPLFKIPDAEVEHAELDSLSIRGATLVLHIRLKNLNAFPIDLENMKYHAEIGDNIHMDGIKEEQLHIPAKGQTNLELPLHFRFGNAGKAILEVLVHRYNLDYHLEQDFTINSKSHALNNCKVHLVKDGKVRSLIRLRDKHKQKKKQETAGNKMAQNG